MASDTGKALSKNKAWLAWRGTSHARSPSPAASLLTGEQNHGLTSLATVLVLKSVSRACNPRELHQMVCWVPQRSLVQK